MRLITLRAQEMWIQELYSYAKEIRVPFSHLIKFAGSKAVDSLRNSRTPAEARAIVRKHENELDATQAITDAQAVMEAMAVKHENPGLLQEVEMAL